ncbi:hypothetical protein CN975_25240, partial [Bacillus cereus]
ATGRVALYPRDAARGRRYAERAVPWCLCPAGRAAGAALARVGKAGAGRPAQQPDQLLPGYRPGARGRRLATGRGH